MSKRKIKEVEQTFNNSRYRLIFMSDCEVLLELDNPPYDQFATWGDEPNRYSRTPQSSALAISLFRWIGKEIHIFIHQHAPPFMYFTTGFDFSRKSLYKRLALKLSKLDYILADNPDSGAFYCYKLRYNQPLDAGTKTCY